MGTAVPSTLPAALHAFEAVLLWPAPDVTDQQLESLIAEDFREIGASGKRLDRSYALHMLRERRGQVPQQLWIRSDEQTEELQPGLVMLSYRLQQGDRMSMRTTLWRRTLDGHWRAVFHQGTPIGG